MWLGHARNSSEVLIGTLTGVVRAWAVRRRTAEERWCNDIIGAMTATPNDPSGVQHPTTAAEEPQLITEDSTNEAEEERTVDKSCESGRATS